MNEALEGLDGIAICADDIIIYGCGEDQESAEKDHDEKFRKLLDRCLEKNLKLNRSKINFKKKEVKFLGHIVTNQGLKPDPEKIRAIQEMRAP